VKESEGKITIGVQNRGKNAIAPIVLIQFFFGIFYFTYSMQMEHKN